ncbi:type II and III secretion system protein family protein [uncultured Dialister sp.]|uniref:type II and III secretion system protein family protein n=1 Tax=uncultured Dialister sp. TaxID=278064 RepID=UPI00265F3E13|nr:pilus assembly protein N-terminal domain-containing protein [uncultured Dialister sp.]
MISNLKRISILTAAAVMGACSWALAATPVNVSLNSSKYMQAPKITRIAIGNPEIADVRMLSARDYLLIGKKAGSTSLIVWSANGVREEYSVYVSGDDQGMASAIQQAIGYPGITAQMMNGKVLLRGTVKNQYEHDTAIKIAQLYLGSGGGSTSSATTASGTNGSQGSATDENIIDLLEMSHPSQIRLEAQLIEINTDDEKNLGIQYWSPTLGNSSSGITPGASGLVYVGEDMYNKRGSFGWIGSHLSTIDASLHALVTNGKARILSRPSITTMSGKTANILIGGRIPIPTSAGDGEISIDWREYGIRLNIEPVVDGENKITSKVHAEVSTLDYGHAVVENNFSIPALASREADAVINVRSGATMAIGGLLNSEDSKTISKIPLLGDLPIIGQFFRHTSKTRDNRELLILITPTLVSEDTEQPMSQQMKQGYEVSQRYARNRENVNLNQPVEQGTDQQERDLWGEKEAPVSTVVVEEKKPEEPVEHLLQVKGKNGETTLVPLSEEDYQKRKNDLQIVKVERDDGTEKQQPVQIQRKQGPEKKFSSPEKKSDVTPKESSSEPDIRDRVRAIMNAYSSDRT